MSIYLILYEVHACMYDARLYVRCMPICEVVCAHI